jgi:hypothetical protein
MNDHEAKRTLERAGGRPPARGKRSLRTRRPWPPALLWSGVLATLAVSIVAHGAVTLAAGSITGSAEPAPAVSTVLAIDRSTGKKFSGKIDAGRFTIADLPVPATYDVILDFKGGRLEGVNMKVPRSEYEEEQPLSVEHRDALKEKLRGLNQFEDTVEILAIDGNIQHAAILVNKLRTKEFYAAKPGEVIWRSELWHFERPEETWVMRRGELSVILYRERIQRAEYERKSVTFDSSLGGVALTASEPAVQLPPVRLPEAKPGIRYRGAGAVTTSRPTR